MAFLPGGARSLSRIALRSAGRTPLDVPGVDL